MEISASCFVSSRERSLSSTRYINSSVLCTVHAVERGSMPSRYFSTNRAIPPVRPRIPVYLNTVYKKYSRGTVARAALSGWRIAIALGINSPNTTWQQAKKINVTARAIP